ncbi:MAG TPA: DUF3089 domain-containing protein [Candidatus Binatia bacterium]|nr:DUF3089 domain-containing protein [Candidatus Binatia bacterium]
MGFSRALRSAGATLAAGILFGAASPAAAAPETASAANPYPGYHSEIYADPSHWLCRPDLDDVCDHDLDATIVRANGTTSVQRWRPASNPKVDCFYVYPTISTDQTGNSDFDPGEDQELFVVRQQAARLGAECRVFAPIYRQITLTALTARLGGNPIPSDSALAYGDVLDAWKHYIANDNRGRGVVLIGHSQGSGHLTALIRNEIDPNPVLRDRLVAAYLLGTSLQVPVGADVGGDFANIPLCHRTNQTGCALAYGSFRSTAPPPSNSLFGVSRGPGLEAACVNPASLSGGRGTLHPYFPTDGQALPILPPSGEPPWIDPSLGVDITTPFVTLPAFVEAECAEHDGFVYLSLIVHGDPSDPRIDDIGGDLTPEWGMHLVDANVAMGDLVALVESQGNAWCARHGCSGRRPLPALRAGALGRLLR